MELLLIIFYPFGARPTEPRPPTPQFKSCCISSDDDEAADTTTKHCFTGTTDSSNKATIKAREAAEMKSPLNSVLDAVKSS